MPYLFFFIFLLKKQQNLKLSSAADIGSALWVNCCCKVLSFSVLIHKLKVGERNFYLSCKTVRILRARKFISVVQESSYPSNKKVRILRARKFASVVQESSNPSGKKVRIIRARKFVYFV